MTTYREFFSSLTDEQLDQPARFFGEESAPVPIEVTVLKEDWGYPIFDESCVDTKKNFEEIHGDKISKSEWKVVWPKGTVFITPK